LCDAIFRVAPLIHVSEAVAIGLPDTIWFPEDGLCALGEETLDFLLFPVDRPELFDAVVTDEAGQVIEIQVKQPGPRPAGSGAHSRCPALSFMNCTRSGSRGKSATNTSARS
jgi:hypothetical protein